MNARIINPNDAETIREIWKKFFKDEFEFPDFYNGYHCAVSIENNDKTVVIGGVRPIAELVCVTNKEVPVRDRVVALKELVNIGTHVCQYYGYDQLHCFLQGEHWIRQVQTVGFRSTVGRSFVMDTDGNHG